MNKLSLSQQGTSHYFFRYLLLGKTRNILRKEPTNSEKHHAGLLMLGLEMFPFTFEK